MNARGTGCIVCPILLLLSGCGTIVRTELDNSARDPEQYSTRSGQKAYVRVGYVDCDAGLAHEAQAAVARYLRDQAAVALGQHDILQVVARHGKSDDLLGQFMGSATTTPTVEADARLDVRVCSVKERKGATVRVAFVSSQSKHATVEVEAALVFENGRRFTARSTARSSKGASGFIAMVDRKAMDKKGGVWELDESMVGTACTEALQNCVSDLSRQLHRDLRRLAPDAAERFLRPRAMDADR